MMIIVVFLQLHAESSDVMWVGKDKNDIVRKKVTNSDKDSDTCLAKGSGVY